MEKESGFFNQKEKFPEPKKYSINERGEVLTKEEVEERRRRNLPQEKK